MIKKILLWTFLAIVLIVGFFYINLIIFEKRGSIVTEGTPIENYQPNNSALLVIDIQEYTTGEVSINEVFKTAADDLIRRINMITEKSAENGIPVIYIRSEISNPLINLMNNSLAVGSLGAQLDRRLNILSDYVIPKVDDPPLHKRRGFLRLLRSQGQYSLTVFCRFLLPTTIAIRSTGHPRLPDG